MKKITFLFAALASALAFTSCEESKDDHPVLMPNDGVIHEDFLNIPEMSNMSVDFEEGNTNQTLHMTCSQPSYGYAATVRYNIEVSLSPDFSTPAVEGQPVSETLPTAFYNCAEINPTYGELATAMSNLLGIKGNNEVPTGYYDIYARLNANIETAGGATLYPNTAYQSNIVKLTRANCRYLAIIIPGLPTGIFLRGGMNDWGAPAEYEFLTTDVAGVSVIESVTIPKGTEFKIADANWADINLGTDATQFEVGKPYKLNGGDNPGNITMPVNFTGRVQLTAVAGVYTVLFEPAEPDTPGQHTGIYLRGDMNGWGADAAWEFITTDVKNVWMIQDVSIAAGNEFKVADPDWASTNLGAVPGSSLTIGSPFVLESNGDNIKCPEAFTGNVQLKLQGGAYKLTLIAL